MARGKGEGAIYQRKVDGLWCGEIELPRSITGKRRRKYFYAKTKKALLEKRRKLKDEYERHGDLSTTSLTVSKWMDYWLEKIATPHLAPNTVTGYRNNVENFINPLFGKKQLRNLTAADVRELHEAVMATPRDKKLRGKENLKPGTKLMSPTSARLAHNTLSAALKAAMADGHLNVNVCDAVTAPQRAVIERKYLNAEQAIQLLQYVSDKPNGAMWATFLLLGLRRGEGLGLEAERIGDYVEISWQLQRYTDESKIPKTYEYRHIRSSLYFCRPKSSKGWRKPPLVEPLRSILVRHLDGKTEGPVFLDHKGEVWDVGDVSKAWAKTLEEAGLPTDVELHGSRRTTATLLREAGVPMTTIQEILGHASIEMTEGYTVGSKHHEMADALEKLSGHLRLTP